MRILLTLASCLGTLAAQLPLTTTFAGGNSQSGNMFDIEVANPAGITIRNFALNLTPGTWDIEVYTRAGSFLPVGLPGTWTLVGVEQGLVSSGSGVPTLLPLCVETFVPSTSRQAFYVTISNGGAMNYTNGTTVGALVSSNGDLSIYEGAGVAYPFGSTFIPRIWNGSISYDVGNTVGQSCQAATWQPFGAGCGQLEFASFYEQLPPMQMTLANQRITGTGTANGYTVTTAPVTSSSIAPGPSAVALVIGDDDEVDTATVGGTLGIAVGSNCWVALGTGNSLGFTPSEATMLTNPATALYAWTDLAPNALGSGQIYYEESGTVATVTYDGVSGWGTGAPNTVQFVWDTSTGDFSIEFGNVGANNLEDWLVGYSPGGDSLDPGAVVLANQTAANPLQVAATDRGPLELTSDLPVLGGTWQLTTSRLDPVSPIAVTFFGARATTPVPLLSLGVAAPGCDAWLQTALASLTATTVQQQATVALPIPATPLLIGTQVSAQSLGLTLQNAASVQVSNGVEGTLGT